MEVVEFSDDLKKSIQWRCIEDCPLVVLDVNFEQDIWVRIPLVVSLDQGSQALAILPSLSWKSSSSQAR